YDPSASGAINFVGDTDTLTLAVDPGQTITVLVTPTSSLLQPSVALFDPSSALIGTVTAAGPNQSALLETIAATTGRTYSIGFSGASSTVGNYTVQGTLNAALEAENNGGSTNDTRLAAQSLDASFVT